MVLNHVKQMPDSGETNKTLAHYTVDEDSKWPYMKLPIEPDSYAAQILGVEMIKIP
jgi:hypothetical protein